MKIHGAKDHGGGRNGSGRLRAGISLGESRGIHPDRLARARTGARDGKSFTGAHWKKCAIEGMDNPAAAAACDIAILTVPFSGAAALLKQLKSSWKPGTIVIDTTVPLAATVGGAATRVLGVWQGSAAEQTQELLPAGVSLAAAFQNLGAETLAGDGPVDCDVLVCSNDETAKQVAFELVGKIPGARALNGGKLENARIVESLTALLIGLNTRYKVHGAGIRFTGLPLK